LIDFHLFDITFLIDLTLPPIIECCENYIVNDRKSQSFFLNENYSFYYRGFAYNLSMTENIKSRILNILKSNLSPVNTAQGLET